MSEPEMPEDKLIAALVGEMTLVRRRGLDNIDLDTHQYDPVEAPQLEAQARAYANDAVSSRIALIRDLMRDALDAWDQRRFHEEATFVRDLFFAEDGGTPGKSSPKTLRDKVKGALDEDAFMELRRARFILFARFLVPFVREKVASDQQSARAQRRGRRLPRFIVAVVVVAAVVVSLSAWLATRNDFTAVFTFDDLGRGSPIIQVYQGPADNPEDRKANGTFRHGQTTTALCKTKGRMVHSDPSVGERDIQSDVWLRVLGEPGKTHYATLVYGVFGVKHGLAGFYMAGVRRRPA
jgi:hypothetical protein